MRLDALAEGARFRIPSLGLTGTVRRVSTSSVLVKYDRSVRTVEITSVGADETTTTKTFESEGRPVSISCGTEVEAIEPKLEDLL